ncbi:DUF6314 family protein [Promicromonospora kroppenstedtii]|uniref:DUF6314 family protein n=1 Tax=Promicromonospora kroppenstedtii TaxID=440482 RepID=UPI0012F79FB2|nr:DUF6314 family protein [Promicromonospora kroppenstedtii]
MDPLRLVGTWDFRREIRHADGAEYSADGEARFSVEDDGRMRWAEHGTLRWAAGTTPVTRTLFVVREPVRETPSGGLLDDGSDGGRATGGRDDGREPSWRVTFEDGRDFHPWTAGAVEHLCGQDLYQGGIEVPTWRAPSWELRWQVTGPEKDYLMHTWYTEH